MVEIVKKQIQSDDDEIRLDRWFKRHYPSYPFSVIAKLARQGQIRVDGKRTDTAKRLQDGQEIRFPLLESTPVLDKTIIIPEKYKNLARDIESDLLYKDEHVIIINKPHGLATQGGSKISVSVDMLSELWKFELENKPKLVHRLDKDTSGVLVLARTAKAAQEVSRLFQSRESKKQYLAILQGVPKPLSGTIDIPLEKKEWKKGFESVQSSAGGKTSITHYKVLDYASKTAALVSLDLITGRTHQIRTHCAEIGCPVLGDQKYNKNDYSQYGAENFLYLHAYAIEFQLFGTIISVTAPPPRHFLDAMKHFGLKLQ